MRLLITETSWPVAAAAKDLAEAGFRLSRVDDGESLLDFVRHGRQDAALVAATLPDIPPETAVARMRHVAPTLPVVALAEPDTGWMARRALYVAGVDAVLDLPMDVVELSARIRSMVVRAAGFDTARLCIGGLELCPATRSVCAGRRRLRLPGEGMDGPNRIPLSPREYDLLEALVLARGRTVSRDEVMDRLYAFEDEPGPRIVDVYVARIRAKLAEAGLNPGMLVSKRAQGLRLDPMTDRGGGTDPEAGPVAVA